MFAGALGQADLRTPRNVALLQLLDGYRAPHEFAPLCHAHLRVDKGEAARDKPWLLFVFPLLILLLVLLLLIIIVVLRRRLLPLPGAGRAGLLLPRSHCWTALFGRGHFLNENCGGWLLLLLLLLPLLLT